MKPKKVSLLGNFGWRNLGNDCTLQAIIYHARKYLPDAEINSICTDPEDTSARYNIPAFPIRGMLGRAWPGQNNPLIRPLLKVLLRIPIELERWVRSFKTLKGTDLLIMPGTGMLSDFAIGPFNLPYDLFRWSIMAKLRKSQLLFVSVGAGPIYNPLTKWFIKSALSLANYRSYRDNFSRQFMENINFDITNDSVYPDLAFSLLEADMPEPYNSEEEKPVIGVGLQTYYGQRGMPQHGEAIYLDYIAKLGVFVTWLLEHGYTARILIGDVLVDERAAQDLREIVDKWDGTYKEGRFIEEPIPSVEVLLAQIAATDLVVATRFHNVLLALMLNKPVVSISYHPKTVALMAEMGLAEYCHHIDHLDVDRLIGQFIQLEKDAECLKLQIQQKTKEYRRALDEQYAFIFSSV
jgi:polysaccharide pyruvyl transferase WcaK-like protein